VRNNNVFIDIDVSKWPLARNENLSTIGTKYPEYSNIHTDIASKYGIDKQFICLTSGAEEAVRICLSTINTSNRVQCSPTYGLVPIFNNIYSKKIKDIPYIKTKTAIIYDTDTISKSLDNVDLIYLSNPNSPTGSTLTKTYISNLVNTYINTLFIIDETYIEFADRTQSIIQLVNTHSNLVVIRSFSKFYGLAASRAGFYATSNNILQQLRPVNPISSNKHISNLMNKFNNISYPFFGLTKKPYETIYSLDKIYIRKYKDSHLETVDDKNISGDYFYRLLTLDNRLKFDYTCKNLQDVIISNIKWGLDCKAVPHDLSSQESVPADKRKVTRIKGNLIWLKNISYPFILSTNESIKVVDELYASIVRVENEWYIREFTYEKELKRAVVLI
jgi:hypothetical protein